MICGDARIAREKALLEDPGADVSSIDEFLETNRLKEKAIRELIEEIREPTEIENLVARMKEGSSTTPTRDIANDLVREKVAEIKALNTKSSKELARARKFMPKNAALKALAKENNLQAKSINDLTKTIYSESRLTELDNKLFNIEQRRRNLARVQKDKLAADALSDKFDEQNPRFFKNRDRTFTFEDNRGNASKLSDLKQLEQYEIDNPPSRYQPGRQYTLEDNRIGAPSIDGGIMPGTPAKSMVTLAPKASRTPMIEAFEEKTGKAAARLGTSRNDIIDDLIVPTTGRGLPKRGPNIIMADIGRASEDIASLLEKRTNPDLLSSKEQIDLRKSMSTILDDQEEVLDIAKSKMTIVQGELQMDYAITPKGGVAFASEDDAREFVAKHIPSYEYNAVTVLGYDVQNQVYRQGVENAPEFLAQIQYARPMSKGVDGTERVIREGASTNPYLVNNVSTGASYIKRLADSITDIDTNAGTIKTLLADVLRPIQHLDGADADAVHKLIKEEADGGFLLTRTQVVQRLQTTARVDAYNALRKMHRMGAGMRDYQFRELLRADGRQTMTHADGSVDYVKPVRSQDASESIWFEGQIYKTGDLRETNIEMDYFRTDTAMMKVVDTVATPYIAARKGNTRLEPLPAQIVRTPPGYIARHLELEYQVYKEVQRTVNGVPSIVRVPVKGAVDVETAQRYADEQGVGFGWSRSREGRDKDIGSIREEMEQMHGMGLLQNSQRGEAMEDFDLTHQYGIDTPMDTLERLQKMLVRAASLDEWTAYNTNKFKAMYKHLLDFNDGFPWNGSLKYKATVTPSPEDKVLLQDATAYRDKIKLVTGMDETQLGRKFQEQMLSYSEMMSRLQIDLTKKSNGSLLDEMKIKPVAFAKGFTRLASKVDPVSAAKAAGFYQYIVLNPIRHLLMQSTSSPLYASVEHGNDYFLSQRAARDLATLAMLKVRPDDISDIAKGWAKATGKTEKDFLDMAKDLEESGIISSISSHQYLESALGRPNSWKPHAGNYAGRVSPSTLDQAGTVSSKLGRGAIHFSARGFEIGEATQRMSAFLAVRNKNIVNKTPKTARQLGVEAAQIAGDMGSANKKGFQNGLIGVPFQFLNHNAQMIHMIMPKTRATSWVANDFLTKQEKLKFAAWSSVMYGADGMGVAFILDKIMEEGGIEVDEGVSEVLHEGMLGYAFEQLLPGDADVEFSKTFAPLSGLTGDIQLLAGMTDRASTPFGKVAKFGLDIALGSPPDLLDAGGPGMTMMAKPVEFMVNMKNILSTNAFDGTERGNILMKEFLGMVPMFNNAMKARIMHNMGANVNQFGSPLTQATFGEAMAKGLFGVVSEAEDELRTQQSKYRGRVEAYAEPTHLSLDKTGRVLAENIVQWSVSLENGEINRQQIQSRLEAAYTGITMSYPDDPRAVQLIRQSASKTMDRLWGDRQVTLEKWYRFLASDDELMAEHGLQKVKVQISRFPQSEYRDGILEMIQKSIDKQEGRD